MIRTLHYYAFTFKGRMQMRHILFLLVLLISTTFAALQTKAQTQAKVTISFDAEQLNVAVKLLQAKTKLAFAYNDKLLMGKKAPVANFEDQSLETVLNELLDSSGFGYKVIGSKVIIVPIVGETYPNVQAGQGPGTIKGRIVEFESSQPLPGASVYIIQLKKGMQSNSDGYYQFNNIPAGKYTLKVTYISYTTETLEVEVKAGKEETYDIKMRGSNALNEVVVSGTRKTRAPVSHTTERQLVGELKAAQSVVSGISSEQISKSADRNAAEAVRKIAGVTIRDEKFIVIRGMNERYNLTYLNNNIAPSTELYSRAFSLDLIPTRIIDRILVYKSAAPDLLGDMTGGAVKIFTKDARNVKHFDLELQTGYRENTTFNKSFLTYQGGKFDFLGFDDGTRKLPASVPGYGDFTRANISQKKYVETFSPILDYGKKTPLPPLQLTANYYNSFKLGGKSLSVLSSLSYKNEAQHQDVYRTQNRGTGYRMGPESQNNESAQLSLLQNFSYSLKDSSHIYFKNFVLQQGQNSTILRNAINDQQHINGEWQDVQAGRSTYLRDIILSYSQRFLYSGNVGGNHHLGKQHKQSVDWNAGYTHSRLDIPDQRAIHLQNSTYTNDSRIPIAGDFEQNWIPVFRSEDPQNQNNNVDMGMLSRVWIRNNENVYNGSVDYSWKLKSWATLKAGSYQQWKERTVFRRAYTLNEGDLNSNGFPDFYTPGIGAFAPDMDFNVVFWNQQDLGKLWSNGYMRDNNTGLKVFDRTRGSDAYTATEQNNSGYAAVSLLPFGSKLDIYGGIRVEYNRQKVAGAISYNTPGQTNDPVLADLKATTFLPSLNISYRPNNDFVLRGAYGKTINRPEFRELSPYSELDYINNQQIQGNSSLVFATVNNYDLRLEWYPSGNAKGETISLGAFHKQIKNPIERTISRELDPNYQLPATVSFQNAREAKVSGLELDIRKNLDFIPMKFFRDLSVIANGSYIVSKVKSDTLKVGNAVLAPAFNRQLQGQSPYTLNAGLYYENAGLGTKASLMYNQIGARIYAAAVGRPAGTDQGNYGDAGTQGSLIELSRRQLDLSITQRLVKSLQVKFSIQNLLDSPVQMAEDVNFTYKYEKVGFEPQPQTASVTRPDKLTGDPLSSNYKIGRFFLLTLTYGF